MSGMFALALLTSGTSAFAADVTTTNSKVIEQVNQVKMKNAIVKSDLNNKTTKNLTNKKQRKSRSHTKNAKQSTALETVQ